MGRLHPAENNRADLTETQIYDNHLHIDHWAIERHIHHLSIFAFFYNGSGWPRNNQSDNNNYIFGFCDLDNAAS